MRIEEGCGEEKERKTKVEVDGLCNLCGIEGEECRERKHKTVLCGGNSS